MYMYTPVLRSNWYVNIRIDPFATLVLVPKLPKFKIYIYIYIHILDITSRIHIHIWRPPGRLIGGVWGGGCPPRNQIYIYIYIPYSWNDTPRGPAPRPTGGWVGRPVRQAGRAGWSVCRVCRAAHQGGMRPLWQVVKQRIKEPCPIQLDRVYIDSYRCAWICYIN